MKGKVPWEITTNPDPGLMAFFFYWEIVLPFVVKDLKCSGRNDCFGVRAMYSNFFRSIECHLDQMKRPIEFICFSTLLFVAIV